MLSASPLSKTSGYQCGLSASTSTPAYPAAAIACSASLRLLRENAFVENANFITHSTTRKDHSPYCRGPLPWRHAIGVFELKTEGGHMEGHIHRRLAPFSF